VAYCSKEESRIDGPWTFGEASRPGKRNDLEAVKAVVKAGGGMAQVLEVATSYQGLRGAELLLKYVEPSRNFKPQVRWYHGSTGSGKTKTAMEEFPKAWMSSKNLKWWEGYDAHEVVVVDDFRKDFCSFHELLRIVDRYGYRVEVKGGSRQLLAKTIVFTCPWAPDVLYENRGEEDVGQLMRRIDEVRLFGNVVPMPVYAAQSNGFVSHNRD